MNRLRVAVLISGGGTTLKNLLEEQSRGHLSIDIGLVIASRKSAGGLAFAVDANIPTHVIRRKDYATAEQHSAKVFGACREAKIDLVVMGGYLSHVLIPDDFAQRVINIHPSLIPKYCGKGFYGTRVHQAVLDAGESVTGCTVHYVDNIYDHGPIILQRKIPVMPADTATTLAARVFAAECEAYPDAIRKIASSWHGDHDKN